MQSTRNTIGKLALFGTAFASTVVMIGAWTRLVDAGLGCPDWPGCYGFLTVPETAEDIALANSRFPEAPVEVEKGWPEMIHRYFATTLGFIILCMSIFVMMKAKKASAEAAGMLPKKHVYGLLVLVIAQGMFGMWTVTLKLWPQVVSGHLMGGFATLSLLFLLWLRMAYSSPLTLTNSMPISPFKRVARVGLVLVVVQIFLGAWTASNYAAIACGDEFPGCQGSLLPEMDLAQGFDFFQAVGPNYLGGLMDNESRVAIHMVHRFGAVVVTLYLIFLALKFRPLFDQPVFKFGVHAVGIVLVIQLVLGVSNVIWLAPLSVAVAHNAVGALLLLTLVNLNFHLARIETRS